MTIAEQIHELLDPLIGEMMATSALASNCGKIHKTPESLASGDMMALSYHLSQGLVFFIGTETAGRIAERIARMG